MVLSAVSDLGPVAQAELGRSIQLDPKDRRQNAVSLTEEGARLLERCETVAREASDTLLAPLSAAEREQFMGLLTRISATEPLAG